MKTKKQSLRLWLPLLLFPILTTLTACKSQDQNQDQAALMLRAENAQTIEEESPILALVLTSRDAKENQELIDRFQETAKEQGARLLVRLPDVSEEEALKAMGLTEPFTLCEVDPIEYQMLLINELVAENADVIAIHPNHKEALDPILTAARAVGIRICAFGQEVGEESRDIYTTPEEAAAQAAVLLRTTE